MPEEARLARPEITRLTVRRVAQKMSFKYRRHDWEARALVPQRRNQPQSVVLLGWPWPRLRCSVRIGNHHLVKAGLVLDVGSAIGIDS